MPRHKYLPLLAFIVISLVFVPVFLNVRSAVAKVDLKAGKGEAVWFYRSCNDGQTSAVATWSVDLNPAVTNQTSLQMQVGNAYPGYQLHCTLYFANSGKLPFVVKDIMVANPNSNNLSLSAGVPAGEQSKVLQPCRFRPAWGVNPTSFSSSCQSKINFTLTIGPGAQENSRMDFAIQVRLEEKTDD